MTTATTYTAALNAITGRLVRVDAVIQPGAPGFVLAGITHSTSWPLRDRVRAAIVNSDLPWPYNQIEVTLDPARNPQRGGGLDLAVAVAVLAAAGSVPATRLPGLAFLAELGLDGRLRPVPGVVPAVTALAAAGLTAVIVSPGTETEARLVPGIRVLTAPDLASVIHLLASRRDLTAARPGRRTRAVAPEPDTDLPEPAWGRQVAEICAAGGHGLLVRGRPGPSAMPVAALVARLMPDLTADEADELTAVHSAAGFTDPAIPLVTRPQLITPDPAVSVVAMLGGGSRVIRPGLVSLAHRGVLYLGGAPEFRRDVLDGLRQPLLQGHIEIARLGTTARFPARFTVVASAALCACGQTAAAGNDEAGHGCRPLALGGPLLDQVDIRVIQPAQPGQASGLPPSRLDRGARARVAAARARSASRLAGTSWRVNAEVPGSELRSRFPLAPGASLELDRAVGLGRVSRAAAGRVLAVAWTLADLHGLQEPGPDQVSAALELRLGAAL